MKCARTACESKNAVCRHTQTNRLYCPRCARKINETPGGLANLVVFPKDKEEADAILAQTGMTNQEKEAALARQYDANATPDQHRGKGWCKYTLNGWTIWECVISTGDVGWASARLVDGHYTDHKYVVDLESAFRAAKGI